MKKILTFLAQLYYLGTSIKSLIAFNNKNKIYEYIPEELEKLKKK